MRTMWFTTALLVLSVCGLDSVLGQQPPPGGYYTTRYDHIDIEHILNQKRLVHYYSECLLDRGPCTPQGIEFKRILPEALRTNCLRCTEKQRFVTLKSIKRLKKEYPHVWAELAAIWDPTGEYVQQLEDSLNKRQPSNTYNQRPEIVQPQPTPTPPAPVRRPTLDASPLIIVTRFGDDVPTNTVSITTKRQETLPTPKSQVQPAIITANTIANKPVSFSTTTPPIVSTKLFPSTSYHTLKTTTKKILTTFLQDKLGAPTTHRISYNYDFAATVKPIQPLIQPVNGINMVIKGVNTIIQPITDIAGRVITAGTDIAGIVLNALGVRRTY